jgi:hypothetical protein
MLSDCIQPTLTSPQLSLRIPLGKCPVGLDQNIVTLLPISNKRISSGSLAIVYDNEAPSVQSYYFVERNVRTSSKSADAIFTWIITQFDKLTEKID